MRHLAKEGPAVVAVKNLACGWGSMGHGDGILLKNRSNNNNNTTVNNNNNIYLSLYIYMYTYMSIYT